MYCSFSLLFLIAVCSGPWASHAVCAWEGEKEGVRGRDGGRKVGGSKEGRRQPHHCGKNGGVDNNGDRKGEEYLHVGVHPHVWQGSNCCSWERVPSPFHPTLSSYLCLSYDGNCAVVALIPYPIISTTIQVFVVHFTLMQEVRIAALGAVTGPVWNIWTNLMWFWA